MILPSQAMCQMALSVGAVVLAVNRRVYSSPEFDIAEVKTSLK